MKIEVEIIDLDDNSSIQTLNVEYSETCNFFVITDLSNNDIPLHKEAKFMFNGKVISTTPAHRNFCSIPRNLFDKL